MITHTQQTTLRPQPCPFSEKPGQNCCRLATPSILAHPICCQETCMSALALSADMLTLRGDEVKKTLKISQDTQECFICDRFWCSLGAVSCCFQTSCNENLAKPTQYFKLQTHQVSSWVARGAPQNGMVSLATSRMSRSSPCSILVNLHLPVGCLARGRAFTCQVLRSP